MQTSLFQQASLFSQAESASPSASPMGSSEKPSQADRQQPWTEAVFSVIDIETTGLNPKKTDITEIVAIQYKNGEFLSMFSTLVQPELGEVTPESTAITGITAEMLTDSPKLQTALEQLSAFLPQHPVIVGHNVPFDIGFLREKAQTKGVTPLLTQLNLQNALCTKVLAQKLLPGLPSYAGMVVATQCGVVNTRAHRAENDVRMCAGILFKLLEKWQATQPVPQQLSDIYAFQGALSSR
ncbi:MAG: 3'-5' exonuclease [Vampirovibrionales bacterium]|nr:3'-5' exonuclease [Vampirovibrionales bacterium]